MNPLEIKEKPALKKNTAHIHPSAVVDPHAEIAEGVEIGPFCVIGPNVKIGKGTVLRNHVVVDGYTTIGERNEIFSGVCLGTPSQIREYKKVKRAVLKIGNDNMFREFVTISPGMKDDIPTVIGDRNLLMINVHIGHDCILGNGITIANTTGLSGHVEVEDGAVIGGVTGVHQFVRIGRLSMTGGVSRVVMDIPPFSLCSGHPARFCGLNSVGLRRAGYGTKDLIAIKKALRTICRSTDALKSAVAKAQAEFPSHPEVQEIIAFIAKSKRGLCRHVSSLGGEE